MTRFRTLHVVLVAAIAGTAPLSAAVTTKAAPPEESPRAAWLEKYTQDRQGQEQTERVAQTFKVGADGLVDFYNLAGNVRVTVGRGNDIQVEAIKRVRHRDAGEGKRLLEALRVEMTSVGNRVQIRTVFPRTSGRGLSASVDFAIVVPSRTSTVLRSVSGDIDVTGVQGDVRAETISGDVNLSATPNVSLAKTVSGDVTAKDIGATTLSLGTISGNVVATALKVKTLEAGTVSGDVRLTDVQVERCEAKSMSGNIVFDANFTKGGHYHFNSHSGNVRIVLANPSGFTLDASTFSGSIRSDFPVTLRAVEASGTGRASRLRGQGASSRAIRGTFGDGSVVLDVRSFSGTVAIVRK